MVPPLWYDVDACRQSYAAALSTQDITQRVGKRGFPATCSRLTKPNLELQVHIYDETTKHEIALLQGGSGYGSSSAPGHSNRVFAVKFHPEDPEVRVRWGLLIAWLTPTWTFLSVAYVRCAAAAFLIAASFELYFAAIPIGH